MDPFLIQNLIVQGKLVSPSQVDANSAYIPLGVYQSGNRKLASGNDAYPLYAIPLSSIMSGGAVWGGITGTLSSQTDLQTILNSKYDTSNPAGYISGITSGDVTTALGFTPYSNTNPANYIDATALAPYLTSVIAGLTYQPVLGYTPENSANKGIANGYAPLESDGKVDAAYLPSYVSDILEYPNLAAFPPAGLTNKIYVAQDTNKVYRWSGSVYIEVAANSGVWGAITGTLANQTDLINYINATTSCIGNNAVTYSGQYKLNGFYGSKNSSINWNNYIHLQPYLINNPHVITEIGLTVWTAVAGSNIRLAIYQDNLGEPGALIYESGNISSATTGFKNFVLPSPLSLTLSQKVVWLAFQVSSQSVSLITGQVFNFIGKQTTGQGGDNRYKPHSFGAFPNPIGATTNVNYSVAMWVRVQ